MMQPDGVARVADGVDDHSVIDAVRRLVAIPSIGGSPAELEVQDLLEHEWARDGFDVDAWDIDMAQVCAAPEFPGMEVDRRSARGVTARLPGTGDGPSLLLLGHTDVVPPGDLAAWSADPYIVRAEGDRLIGRGTCDMKGGVAALWYAARAIRDSGVRLRGDLILAAVSGEEDGGLGTFALLQRGITADACIVPEPTNLDLVPANGGALTFRLIVHGRATHASRRTEGVSAIDKLAALLGPLEQLETQRNAQVDPLMSRWPLAYPLSIGTVHAGDWASTVPDLLVAEGRLGVALGETPEQARAALESCVAAFCATDPWLADNPIEVQWWGGQFASGRTDPAHPMLSTLSGVHRTLGGRAPDVYGGPYGSDLRLLVGAGIPTVQFGPGDSAAAHAPDEWVDAADVVACTRTLAAFAVEYCGIA